MTETKEQQKYERIADRLAEWNPAALLADGFEEALIGIGERANSGAIAVYDQEKCIETLMGQGMDRDTAVEYFEFNVLGAWMGEGTPMFVVLDDC